LTFLGAARRLTGRSFSDLSQNPVLAAEALIAAFDFIGGDLIGAGFDLSVEAADFGQKIVYPENSTAHPDYSDPYIKDPDDYEKIKRIDLKDAERMQNVLEMCRIVQKKVGLRAVMTGFVFGPLGVLNMMRGAKHLLRDCINCPSKIMPALEVITEVLIEYIEAQGDIGVQCIALDTLFASWNGLTKDLWERIEGPFAGELANAARRKGCSVAIHNCGDGIYFDAQIRSMNPDVISFAKLPDDCKTPEELKKRYGGNVVLMGCIDTSLLIHGTAYEVMQACRRQIEELAEGGGFILAPGCEFPPDAPLENAIAIVQAAKMYG